MKTNPNRIASMHAVRCSMFNVLPTLLLLAATGSASAATVRYVDVNNTNATLPYTNWATAAATIQQAVDAAAPGDEIVVTNGTYATGGRAVGTNVLVNRVAVDKPLTVRSVTGPEFTIIQGYQVPGGTFGDGAIRCVYLTNGAVLSGFTLIHGATRGPQGGNSRDWRGGGVWCESINALVTNCTLTGNSASFFGGGAYLGTLNNCTLTGNWAGGGGGAYACTLNNCTLTRNSAYHSGGGAYGGTLNNCTLTGNSVPWSREQDFPSSGGGASSSTLNNCTLTGNSAREGGGADSSTLNNCILYYNTAGTGPNDAYYSTLNYCYTTPLPGWGAEPQLASVSHLSASSPCRGAGSAAYATGLDIDGELWLSPPSIGCDEYRVGAVTGAVTVAMETSWTNVAAGFPVDLTAWIGGRVAASAWDFGDGTVLSNRPYARHAWAAAGDYPVVLRAYNESHPEGVSATVTVRVVPVRYVSATSANPVPPYSSWETAARTIQEAVDVTMGGEVVVTNGVYATGGRAVSWTMTNRVAVDRPVMLRSVNGPEVTVIQGYQLPGTTNGNGAIRCVYLTSGASLSGFTLTNGATRNGESGGGVWCESATPVVSNCVLIGNSASDSGGGAYLGTLNNCTLTGNSASQGGGASGFAGRGGGIRVTLNNCTLTGNQAHDTAGGASFGQLNNCIVFFNTATSGANNYYEDQYAGFFGGVVLNYCCTTPMPTNGVGNITNAPLVVDYAGGNLRLQSNSPCINAGLNAYAPGPTDLDGLPRIVSGTVDIGAYEFQPQGYTLFITWLQQYGLPTNGSADFTDSDTDGRNNWQEWRCLTDPTNALSVLRLLSPSPAGTNVAVSWQSVAGVNYLLERSTNLSATPPFTLLAPNLPGQPGTTTYTDPNAATAPRLFYRVGVRD